MQLQCWCLCVWVGWEAKAPNTSLKWRQPSVEKAPASIILLISPLQIVPKGDTSFQKTKKKCESTFTKCFQVFIVFKSSLVWFYIKGNLKREKFLWLCLGFPKHWAGVYGLSCCPTEPGFWFVNALKLFRCYKPAELFSPEVFYLSLQCILLC